MTSLFSDAEIVQIEQALEHYRCPLWQFCEICHFVRENAPAILRILLRSRLNGR